MTGGVHHAGIASADDSSAIQERAPYDHISVKREIKMNKSTRGTREVEDLRRDAEIKLIDERIANAKGQGLQQIRKWLRGVYLVLGALILILGIDKTTLNSNVGGFIHR